MAKISEKNNTRCRWASGDDALMQHYHDTEWGVPVRDDTKLFEHIILDGAQAGLSWRTILYRREGYRRAFKHFDAKKVAKFGPADVERLMQDPGIIRNRLKIESTITNARCFLEVQKEFGSFSKYLWGFVGGKPLHHRLPVAGAVPATSPESDAMSKDLRARGFKFVGSTICYAFMQAAGLINDHTADCFRCRQCK